MAAPVRGPRGRWGEQLRRPVAEQGGKAVQRGRHGAQHVLPGSGHEEEPPLAQGRAGSHRTVRPRGETWAGNVRVVSMAAGSDPRPAGRGSIAQGASRVQSAGGRGSTRV